MLLADPSFEKKIMVSVILVCINVDEITLWFVIDNIFVLAFVIDPLADVWTSTFVIVGILVAPSLNRV